MKKLYAKKYLIIYHRPQQQEYIVQNTNKIWEEGHTHIKTYKQAKYLVDCELNKKVPMKVNKYFLISLQRITKDTKYYNTLQRRIDNNYNNCNYHNRPAHLRK